MPIRDALNLPLVLALYLLCGSAVHADPPTQARLEVPIGMTAQGTPIVALINKEDQNLQTVRRRILLVGETRAHAVAIKKLLSRFDTEAAQEDNQSAVLVSAIPNCNPDGVADVLANFPPKDGYYHRDHEAAYLARWIGMFAPDLVLKLKLPGDPVREPIVSSAFPTDVKLCDVDKLESAVLILGAKTDDIPTAELFKIGEASAMKSPARKELLRRQERSPREITEELLQVYGKDLKVKDVAYIPALAVIGRLRYGAQTKSDEARAQVAEVLEKFMPPEVKLTPKSGSAQAGHLLFAEAAEGASPEKKQRLIELVRAAADQIFDESGKARPLMPFHNEMSDAVFMSGPILAAAGSLTGEAKYYDACYQHLLSMRKLCLREDGLYRHSPLDEAAWGRGNGFPALGLCWTLHYWPKDDPRREEILGWQRDHLTALLAHQDYSGCWHQVIDKPASYREFSCTAMIGYAMLEGILAGELDCAKFEPAMQRAWKAIKLRVGPQGRLVDVCTGTGKQKSLQDYYDRPAILGVDDRGGAMALLFATSMMRQEPSE